MSQDAQSIEDLVGSAGEGKASDESVQAKFSRKQKEIKLKELERIAEKEAAYFGLPYANLYGFSISPEALFLIKEEEIDKYKVICFYYDGQNIRIATTEPESKGAKELLSSLREQYFCNGKMYLISQNSFDYVLRLYKNLPKVRKIIRGVEIKEKDLEKFKNEIKDYRNLNEKINKVNMSDVITLILATALKINASDIHVEAEEKGVAIRLRIDGVLQEAAVIDKKQWKKIINRMKLLARVKMNVSDKPQDGRFNIYLKDSKINVRSSFLPTAFGESVAMRVLQSDIASLSFENLGLSSQAYEILKKEISKPNGLVLTTGPTGSGKTTTLYAIMNKLNKPGTKIITLEDPIEYELEGINQSQVDAKKDYTFSKGLRSILRQDPDIIMVGEIRDLETAEISIQASLTGHLVLSTLHTNDASGVIPRLIDIGVKPYFVAPSINAIIGQRLVRKLCPHCREEHEMTESEAEQVKKILAVISPKSGIDIPLKLPKIYKVGKGCEHCSGIGYKGRIGIYEIFTVSDNIKQLIADNAPSFKILQQAIEEGMVTMLQDGVLRCLAGTTSLEEVYRIIGKFDYVDELYDIIITETIGRGIKLSEADIIRGEELSRNLSGLDEAVSKTAVKEVINVIIATAVKSEAGDIHIEPAETGVKIRFRIDGILHDVANLSKDHYLQLLSKIKTLAGFPTNVKKAAWDGRFGIFLKDLKMDCRLSVISGGYGETVVIRLLLSQASALKMEELGMKPYTLKTVNKSIAKTRGIIITTGPTGSGKTTTLYAIMNKLNKPDIKIITVEDPIEYHLEGIMQTQIDVEQDYTFAVAMKSLFRQNPNIMMIGEIRDSETAKIAIEASQTGHLVLSTIHANSAAGAISRFAGLGVEKEILMSSLECSIGQRLVRRICPGCKEEVKLPPDQLKEVKEILNKIKPVSEIKIPGEFKFYKGKGCKKCGGIGYKGRLGLYEVIEITSDIQEVIHGQRITDHEIEQAAANNGMVSMIQDGILKALEGKTTIEEVFRVAK